MKTAYALLLPLMLSIACAQNSQPLPSIMTTPVGTTLPVVIVRQVQRNGMASNDRVFVRTIASVVSHGHILVPAGTELQGEIVSMTQHGFLHPSAALTVHFPEAILTNSYVVPLDDELSGSREAVQITISAAKVDNVLLDVGTTFDLPLRTPLNIELARIFASPQSPASVFAGPPCRPITGTPGTPGTLDTVVPGIPATPDTVMPGVNGAPPTIIPGTPAGPPTVIHGMPATPGTPAGGCAAAPQITSVVLVP